MPQPQPIEAIVNFRETIERTISQSPAAPYHQFHGQRIVKRGEFQFSDLQTGDPSLTNLGANSERIWGITTDVRSTVVMLGGSLSVFSVVEKPQSLTRSWVFKHPLAQFSQIITLQEITDVDQIEAIAEWAQHPDKHTDLFNSLAVLEPVESDAVRAKSGAITGREQEFAETLGELARARERAHRAVNSSTDLRGLDPRTVY